MEEERAYAEEFALRAEQAFTVSKAKSALGEGGKIQC